MHGVHRSATSYKTQVQLRGLAQKLVLRLTSALSTGTIRVRLPDELQTMAVPEPS